MQEHTCTSLVSGGHARMVAHIPGFTAKKTGILEIQLVPFTTPTLPARSQLPYPSETLGLRPATGNRSYPRRSYTADE